MSETRRVVPPGRQGPGSLPAAAVARIDLTMARRVGGALPGEHRTPGAAAGTELAQLRPYEPGDDPRRLDPAASARTGVPHVRLLMPERSLTTWIVLDISPSMAFGTGRRLKSDVAEGVAHVVAHTGVRRGGRIALITAGAAGPRMLAPRGGRGALAAVHRLTAEGVAPDGETGAPSLADTLGRVRRLARSRGLVVVVSDLRDAPADGQGTAAPAWERPLRLLRERHATVVVEVRDPREGALPDAGTVVFVDPESGQQVEADTSSPKLRAAFAALEDRRRADVAASVRRAGAQHVVLSTDQDWLRELARQLR